MIAGFNMLSFDLFGLGRRMQDKTQKHEGDAHSEQPRKDDPEQRDRDQEHELFFWSLYPVI